MVRLFLFLNHAIFILYILMYINGLILYESMYIIQNRVF